MKELTLNEMEYISGGFNLFGAASGLLPTRASASPLLFSPPAARLPPSSATARWRLVPS